MYIKQCAICGSNFTVAYLSTNHDTCSPACRYKKSVATREESKIKAAIAKNKSINEECLATIFAAEHEEGEYL